MKNIDNDLFLRKNQLEGTMYVEFKYSSAEKEFWNEDSYYWEKRITMMSS
ncbi:hypothetical protein OPJ22_000231 [Listeria innocua]|nr:MULTISPECIES: hypothetical protein [Listeria]EDN7760809.1 hypothetical protein [Listeria monocytogenes]EDO1162108.1 hypothetical protein [Listeria innocua]EDO1200738.1 hypothetical protein [Listeria innocua]EHF3590123.1 hypothetical protein [Listeria innocua]EHF3593146.1 hypothetical protein [Listeria innocua]